MAKKNNQIAKTGKSLLEESMNTSFDVLFNEKEEDVDITEE